MRNLFYLTTISLSIYSCQLKPKDVISSPVETLISSQKSINIDYLDKTIQPKEDFFLFSNGTWLKNNPVPPSESRWGSFNELEKNNNEKLTGLLEGFQKTENVPGSDGYILGNYYRSFMDMETRNNLGLTPIQKEMDRVKNIRSKSELAAVIADQHVLGISSMFSFGVGQDLKNVNGHISYIGQGGIGLPSKEYYFQDKYKSIREAYQVYVKEVFTMIGYSQTDADKIGGIVLEFETKLASSMMTPAERRDPDKTYNKMSRQKVSTMLDKLDFEQYLLSVGSKAFDSIIVSQPKFIEGVNDLIVKESLESLQYYLLWKVINNYAGNLSDSFVNENFKFYGKILKGTNEMKPINERAINEITRKDFGELLGKVFVEKYFSSNAQKKVNTMVDNLLFVFQERITNLDWMSQETKKEALTKLNSIGRKLGFPSKWEDYSKLKFRPDTYIENIKMENIFSHYKNLEELSQPVDKEKWGMPAHMVNAYYQPLLNEIAFPAGIMQPPFFDENAEDAVNYGRIGMVIGHEFTHGFDDMGSKFAADGTFKNWWSDEDRSLFEEKTKILGETYSAFCPLEGNCVNPDLTMGENIADLGGLTMAYYAYARTDEFKKNEIREGFAPAQRFFIAYAQLWKIKYTDEEMKNRIANDPHSPGMYRVNGPLKNCPEFFNAFSVEENRPMRNSSKKIAKIW